MSERETAALITHSHPPATTDAVECREAAARGRVCSWSRPPTRSPSTARAAKGIETVDELPERPRPLPRPRRRRLDPLRAAPLRPHRRSGLRRQLRHRRLPRRGRARRRPDGDQRALAGDLEMVDLPGPRDRARRRGRGSRFNDVSFIRRPHDRVAELTYRIAGEEVGDVRCDGLVAATPAGSTGYNLANQGPILAWGVKGYVVSYISPHSLTARALVVAPDDVLHVGNAAGREPVDVSVDGEPGRRARTPGDELEVRFSTTSAALAQLPGRASTTGSARSSATSPSEPTGEPVL